MNKAQAQELADGVMDRLAEVGAIVLGWRKIMFGSKARNAIADALLTTYWRGEEAMRERAIIAAKTLEKECEEEREHHGVAQRYTEANHWSGVAKGCSDVADAIRSLPSGQET